MIREEAVRLIESARGPADLFGADAVRSYRRLAAARLAVEVLIVTCWGRSRRPDGPRRRRRLGGFTWAVTIGGYVTHEPDLSGPPQPAARESHA
jgi:hypothetical protein